MPTTEAPGVAALQAILRLDTVASHDAATTDEGPFLELHRLLRAHFPLTHDIGEVLDVPPHGLLVRVPAAADSAGADADPVVLMAHMDIVPVGEATRWTHDPLGGDVVDGVIWGRGTLDDKGQLVAAITAVESLLADGLRPARDVWLSFGSDEEVMGTGAQNAVQVLCRRGVSPWFVLDEGGAVASGAFPGVTRPLGVVGVSEKGVLSLRLTASGRGGHASRPAKGGPAARMAAAITRLERRPFPAHLSTATLEMLRRLRPHLPRPVRPVLDRAERFPGALARVMVAAGPEAAALARTTVAVTTLSGSPAINVSPTAVRAGLNLRIAVGETAAAATERIRRIVRDRLQALHGDLPAGLPVRALPDGPRAARVDPRLRRAARPRGLPRRDPLVPEAARLPAAHRDHRVSPGLRRLVPASGHCSPPRRSATMPTW